MTKKRLNNSFPCTCGHSKINHRSGGNITIVLFYGASELCWVYDCDCKDFRPDNLKYLERQNDKNL